MAQSADNPGVVARPPLLYGAAFLLVLVLTWFWPLPIFGRAGALWVGLALAVLAIALAVWGRRTMLAAGTNIDPTLPTSAIVTSGPFRFSRNPLYVALTLLYVGLTLAVDTWWGLILLVPLLVTMHLGVVLREERYLERKFGEDYRRYKAGVARYVPPI
jgi:protein-S-isoprenylcysteine O-methyltransferase Ste14